MKIKLLTVLTVLLALGYSNKSIAQYKPSSVIITGHSKVSDRDSIALQILQEFGSGSSFQAEKILKTYADKSGYFKFEIKNVTKPFYITTYNLGSFPPFDWRIHSLQDYLVEPGDSVNIDFDETLKEVKFSGKGATKYRWRYNVVHYWKQFIYSSTTYEKQYKNMLPELESKITQASNSLDSIKKNLTPMCYNILKADALQMLKGVYSSLAVQTFGKWKSDSSMFPQTLKTYEQKLLNYKLDTINSLAKAYSQNFAIIMVRKSEAEFAYRKIKKLPNAKDEYSLLKASYSKGLLRDKAITTYMHTILGSSPKFDSLLVEAIKEVSNPYYRQKLKDLRSNFGIGQQVQNFDFQDNKGNKVKLGDFKGKVVLVDMWFTGCSGCIDVAAGLPAVEEKFHDNQEVVFISLCVDKKKDSWLRSIDPNNRHGKSYTHYTTSTTRYLYTGGQDTPFISRYNPNRSYPQLLLISKNGKMLSSNPTKPYNSKGQEALVIEIKNALK